MVKVKDILDLATDSISLEGAEAHPKRSPSSSSSGTQGCRAHLKA